MKTKRKKRKRLGLQNKIEIFWGVKEKKSIWGQKQLNEMLEIC